MAFDFGGLGFERWRDVKRAFAPKGLNDLLVEIADIARPSAAERAAIIDRVRRCNMAVYAERTPEPGRDDKAALKSLAATLGLARLDDNPLADDDGVTPLAVHNDGARARYIPYTERPIAWHTDGYYNPPERRVRGLMLHCVRPAAEGGANRLMDPDQLFIALMEQDPALVRALMRHDAMTIPANEEEGMERPEVSGPVIFDDGFGFPVFRYTARSRNVVWSTDAEVRRAAQAVAAILAAPSPFILAHRLEAGQGLVSNNVLHTREPFRDDPSCPRLLYRARFHDKVRHE